MALVATVALTLGSALSASARTVTLRWTHADLDRVEGFRAHWGTNSRDYSDSLDLGKPSPDSTGVLSSEIEVPDHLTVFVSLTAYGGAGLESPFSNEEVRTGIGDEPPPDSGGGDGSGGGDLSGGGSDGSGGGDGSGGSGEGEAVIGAGPTAAASSLIFFENFSEHALGTNVVSWQGTQSYDSLEVDDQLFEVRSVGGDRMLSTSSSAVAIHSHLISAESREWSGYEVRGRMRGSRDGSRIGVTALSQFPDQDAYYRISTAWQTGEFEIFGHPWTDPGLSCLTPGTGVRIAGGQWYRFKLKVSLDPDGTRLRGKVWRQDSEEPAEWQAACFDQRPDRPTAGTIGVWTGAGGTKDFDDLEVVALPGPEPPPAGTSLTAPGQPQIVIP